MKVYAFGEESAPAILLLPGTCCHWKSNFGHVIPLLAREYRVLCVSYDGFDETENTEFPTMTEEPEKIEAYIKEHCGGHIRAAYGSRFLQKMTEKQRAKMPEYVDAFMGMFGGARPYVTEQSCKNQFYSDLVTPLPEKIAVPGTEIHVFYALKMGEKYRGRYERHFVHPVLHEQNLQHEELLACYPEKWAQLVKSIIH